MSCVGLQFSCKKLHDITDKNIKEQSQGVFLHLYVYLHVYKACVCL